MTSVVKLFMNPTQWQCPSQFTHTQHYFISFNSDILPTFNFLSKYIFFTLLYIFQCFYCFFNIRSIFIVHRWMEREKKNISNQWFEHTNRIHLLLQIIQSISIYEWIEAGKKKKTVIPMLYFYFAGRCALPTHNKIT